MVEQFPLKEKVDGSNPSGLTEIRLRSIMPSNEMRFAYESIRAHSLRSYLLHLAQIPVERSRPPEDSFKVSSPFSIFPPSFPK